MAVTFSNIGLAEPSTVTNRIAAITIDRGGANEQQEILSLGDPESSVGIARVVGTAPDSTHMGLVVRIAQPSTTFNVSSLAGIVQVRTDTNWASSAGFHFDSSGALQIILPVGAATEASLSALSGDVGDTADAEALTGNGTLIAIAKGLRTLKGGSLNAAVLQATSSGDTTLMSSGTVRKLRRIEASNSHATAAVTIGLKVTSLSSGAVFGKKYLPAAGGLGLWVWPNGYLPVTSSEAVTVNMGSTGQVEVTAYYD